MSVARPPTRRPRWRLLGAALLMAVAAAFGLTLPGLAQDRETGGDPKGAKEGDKPGKLEPPRLTCRHTTARGNEGDLQLPGGAGHAAGNLAV